MIGFLFVLAVQPISRKTEGRVNLRYLQVVYICIQYVYNTAGDSGLRGPVGEPGMKGAK